MNAWTVSTRGLNQRLIAAGDRGIQLTPRAIVRHAIHNTVPALLTITGLQIGYLLGGVLARIEETNS
jgi:ABC-type dipeptide/oligopeptide/nickel transport system permease component